VSGGHDATAAWVAAVALDALDESLPTSVVLDDGRRLCLVREGATVHAMEDRCPHRDFALSGGDVVAPCVIECPWHGARFDLRTGAVLQGPATDAVPVYPVQVTDGMVFVGRPTGDPDAKDVAS